MFFQGSGLFAKILLWFVATVAVVAIVFAGTVRHLQGKVEDDHQAMTREMLDEQGRFFVFFLEATDFPKPKKFESLQFIPIWFFDQEGRLLFATRKAGKISNRENVPGSSNGSRRSSASSDADVSDAEVAFEEPSLNFGPLVKEMAGASESFRQFSLGSERFIDHRIPGRTGKVYFAFLRQSHNQMRQFLRFLFETSAGSWIFLATGIIGLLSFWLAKYLVNPIIQMQNLSRIFSAGDLQARLPIALTERYDELGALANDFNKMAARIELIVQGQRQLLWDVSHELRTPLTRIGLSLELARKAEPEKRETLIAKVEQNLKRLDGLIQQILDLARLGQMKEGAQSFAEVDLTHIVASLLADVKFEAEAQSRTLTISLPSDAISLRGSEELLRRAVENVVRNSFQHTPKEASIKFP